MNYYNNVDIAIIDDTVLPSTVFDMIEGQDYNFNDFFNLDLDP